MASTTLKIGQSISFTTNCVDSYGNPAPGQIITTASSAPQIAMVTNNTFLPGSNNTIATNVITAISNGNSIITITINTNSGIITNTIDVTVASPDPTIIDIILGQATP